MALPRSPQIRLLLVILLFQALTVIPFLLAVSIRFEEPEPSPRIPLPEEYAKICHVVDDNEVVVAGHPPHDVAILRLNECSLEVTNATVARFPNTRIADIWSCNVSDSTLELLSKAHDIEMLSLSGANVSNDGLRQLRLPHLRQLSLHSDIVVDSETITILSQLVELEELQLVLEAPVEGFDAFQNLRKLRSLTITGSFDDGSLDSLVAANLRCLDLGGTQITDAGIANLLRFRRLGSFRANGCQGITNESLPTLARHPFLSHCNLGLTSVKHEACEVINAAHPYFYVSLCH